MDPKSRSAIKREMLALQEMAEQLVDLSADQIEKMDLPSDLREAVLLAKTLKTHGAQRRQKQYLGVLMRKLDPEPIQRALAHVAQGRSLALQIFHQIEQRRDELVAGNDSLIAEIVAQFPEADSRKIRELAARARKEKETNQPPKSSRALFRYLRGLAEPPERDPAGEVDFKDGR